MTKRSFKKIMLKIVIFTMVFLLVIAATPGFSLNLPGICLLSAIGFLLAGAIKYGKKYSPQMPEPYIVENTMHGQSCYAVEFDGAVVSNHTWIPVLPDTTAKIGDVFWYTDHVLIKVHIFRSDELIAVRQVNCELPNKQKQGLFIPEWPPVS